MVRLHHQSLATLQWQSLHIQQELALKSVNKRKIFPAA